MKPYLFQDASNCFRVFDIDRDLICLDLGQHVPILHGIPCMQKFAEIGKMHSPGHVFTPGGAHRAHLEAT